MFWFSFKGYIVLPYILIQIENLIIITINHPGTEILCFARDIPVVKMNVPVQEVFRAEFFDKPPERPESPVGQVFPVMDIQRRRVSDQYIGEPSPPETVPPEFGDETVYLPLHLLLGILMVAPIITHGTFQPEERHISQRHRPAVEIDSAEIPVTVIIQRGLVEIIAISGVINGISRLYIILVVISANIVERFSKHRDEIIQIILGEIAAGYN
jgi:hypothetical protein